MRNLPSLNSLKSFEAAGRHMNFSSAAIELNVTQGAISRQIKFLENYLGVLLFKRSTKNIELTEDGATFAAVGAAHLAGKKGILRLLKLNGFIVKPVSV